MAINIRLLIVKKNVCNVAKRMFKTLSSLSLVFRHVGAFKKKHTNTQIQGKNKIKIFESEYIE